MATARAALFIEDLRMAATMHDRRRSEVVPAQAIGQLSMRDCQETVNFAR